MGPESEEVFQRCSEEEIHETIQKLSSDAAVQTLDEKLFEIYRQFEGSYQWQVLDRYLVQYDDEHLGLVYVLRVFTRTPVDSELTAVSGVRVSILLTE